MREFLRQLRWLEPVVDLARLGGVLGLVALGLFAAWRARGSEAAAGRRAVDLFLLYVVGASLAVGLLQIEAWPFTTWALVHGPSPRQLRSWELQGLDAGGRGYVIDPVVLQPIAPEEFGGGLLPRPGGLTPEGRARVARFVLRRAEWARVRLLNHQPFARNDWLLGPLAAPSLVYQARIWRSPADVPPTPFVALRIWLLEWDVEERFADERRVTRRLLVEVRDAPAA